MPIDKPLSKTKLRNAAIAAKSAALPKNPEELIDQIVRGQPMTGEEVNAASMAFNKVLVEKEVGPIRNHHLAVADNRREQQDLAAQVPSLLHDKPTGFALVKGRPPSLSFRDKAQGARYEELHQRLIARQTKANELGRDFDAYQRKTSEVLMEAVRVQREGR